MQVEARRGCCGTMHGANTQYVHDAHILSVSSLYTLECLPRVSTLQIGPNTCPHCAHTECCLALMDQQPTDRATHCSEVDCIALCDLHACPHWRSVLPWGCLSAAHCASLFPDLRYETWKYTTIIAQGTNSVSSGNQQCERRLRTSAP